LGGAGAAVTVLGSILSFTAACAFGEGVGAGILADGALATGRASAVPASTMAIDGTVRGATFGGSGVTSTSRAWQPSIANANHTPVADRPIAIRRALIETSYGRNIFPSALPNEPIAPPHTIASLPVHTTVA
jgi:hypothetical protein